MRKLSLGQRLLAVSALLVAACSAQAQSFPSKSLRLVVPFPPGGSTDTVTRLVAKRLSEEIGQPVVVDNRAGAGGAIGVKDVLRAPADGYTLLFTPMGPVSIAPALSPNLGYTAKDLQPIARLFRAPFFVMTGQNSPYKTAQELLAAGKSSRAPMYGSSGNGALSHVLGEALNQAASTAFVHVPYKGGAPMLQALTVDEVQWALLQAADAKTFADAGRMRPLMVLSNTREEPWATAPTAAELGLKGLNLRMWNGVFAPAGTPRPVVEFLNKKIVSILAEPAIQGRLSAMAADNGGSDNQPDVFRKQIEAEVAMFTKLVADTKLKVD